MTTANAGTSPKPGNRRIALVGAEGKHETRAKLRDNPIHRPDDVVLAWVKRQHRLPLTLLEASWLIGISRQHATEICDRALRKIRAELERTMFTEGR